MSYFIVNNEPAPILALQDYILVINNFIAY